jgi:hypothetical protein
MKLIKPTGIILRLLILAGLPLLAGCLIAIQPDLKNHSQEMRVLGRQGMGLPGKITFGEFSTDMVARGWITRVNFAGAPEKLSFNVFDGNGRQAAVAAESKLRGAEMNLNALGSMLRAAHSPEQHFAGAIYLQHRGQTYDFIVHNPESNTKLMPTQGHLVTGSDEKIEIRGITQLYNRRLRNVDNLGFEYVRGDQVVGATQVSNRGRVWLRRGLDEDTRLVLAALSTALMIRHDRLSDRQ